MDAFQTNVHEQIDDHICCDSTVPLDNIMNEMVWVKSTE